MVVVIGAVEILPFVLVAHSLGNGAIGLRTSAKVRIQSSLRSVGTLLDSTNKAGHRFLHGCCLSEP